MQPYGEPTAPSGDDGSAKEAMPKATFIVSPFSSRLISRALRWCVSASRCVSLSQEDLDAFMKKEGTPAAALEKLQRLLRWHDSCAS